MGSVAADHFERLYRVHADPWHVGSAWYERRKRGLLLACLGREHYAHAFEPGCGGGDLTRRLAQRCGRVCAVDVAGSAVARCRARLAADGIANVDVLTLDLPRGWPAIPPGGFDLIVVSELAYYLDDASLGAFLAALDASLAAGGELAACHWLAPFDDRVQPTDAVHDALAALPGLSPAVLHREEQFRLDLWRRRP